MTKRNGPRRGKAGAGRRPSAAVEVTVAEVGARGDGLASLDGRPLYVPLTLPGERIRARPGESRGDGRAAVLEEVLAPSPLRLDPPPCRYFGACGGCQLQHMQPQALAAWKRDLVVQALGRRGFSAVAGLVSETVATAPGTRRRATFAMAGRGRGLTLGFNARASHQVIPIDSCLLPDPALWALTGPLRALLATLPTPARGGDVTVTLTDSGADVVLDLAEAPDLIGREALAAFAEVHDLARLSLRVGGAAPEIAAQRRAPQVRLGGTMVTLPAGGFLQPSREGEAALVERVLAAVATAPAGAVADLFGGIGTFALPLHAAGRAVHLVEGAPAAVASVAGLALPGLTAEARDLFDQPLAGKELKRFAAVVFDPPRAGAAAQAAALAEAGPDVVVAVSCAPATFARDARLLVDGGYAMESVVPVDQFPWSAHVEVVAVFRR